MNEICLSCRKHTKCGRAEHETIGCGYYVPMTEQEYLQTCNTEQLAEFIVNLTLLDKYKLYDQMESAEYEHGIGIGAKKVIVEWLKQPTQRGET